MLALRNAVCNDRWREMWQKALKHHRKLQALQRSARAEQRAQAFLAVGNSSRLSSPPQSAAVSEYLSPPAPSQPVSEAEAPLIAPPVPEASLPSSCRPSARRKRQTGRKRRNSSPQRSGEVSRDACLCGTPLVGCRGHRTRQFCSDRCRQRAYRKRQAQISSRRSPPQRLEKEAYRERGYKGLHHSPQPFVRVNAETCPCGTSLVRKRGHRAREYCSDRCRQRAYRERQAQVL